MESKVNQLLKQWPPGTVAASPWLIRQGVSRQLARRYTASGWLQPLGRGAFIRAGEPALEWFGALYALQTQLGLTVHPAAGTALSLLGFGHNLPFGSQAALTLFSDRRERLPPWFTRHGWPVRIEHHAPSLFDAAAPESLTDLTRNGFPIRVSSPERAILELLHLVTTNDAVTSAIDVMSGLSTLRPQVVQNLLEACRSVKAKRLFLWTAETAGHDWFSRLDPERLDLGKGKRSIYRGGRFDAKYRITVPRQEEVPNV